MPIIKINEFRFMQTVFSERRSILNTSLNALESSKNAIEGSFIAEDLQKIEHKKKITGEYTHLKQVTTKSVAHKIEPQKLIKFTEASNYKGSSK